MNHWLAAVICFYEVPYTALIAVPVKVISTSTLNWHSIFKMDNGHTRDMFISTILPHVLPPREFIHFTYKTQYFLESNDDRHPSAAQPVTMTFQRYSITLDSRGVKIRYGQGNEKYLRDLFPQFTSLQQFSLPGNISLIIDTLRNLLQINEAPISSYV